MTSQISGYVTVGNASKNEPGPWWKDIHVTSSDVLMVSFKQLKKGHTNITLLRRTKPQNNSLGSGKQTRERIQIWKSFDIESNFYSIHNSNGSEFVIQVSRKYRWHYIIGYPRFQFFFTFFPQSKKPRTLSTGFLNCSIEVYSSFQHHVTCNHKTECEDGRDETEHCPFSSASCQGLLTLCDRCYKVIWNVHSLQEDGIHCKKVADEHCRLLGGVPSIPLRLQDLYSAFIVKFKGYLKFPDFCFGFYYNDKAMPRMYKESIYRIDRAIFHHHFELHRYNIQNKMHLLLNVDSLHITYLKDIGEHIGTICEISTNESKENSGVLNTYFPADTISLGSKRYYSMAVCQNGHMTHKYLSCGSNREKMCPHRFTPGCHLSALVLDDNMLDRTTHEISRPSTFMCNDELITTLSYSLVCDFTADCLNSRDESFCKHPVCMDTFYTCTNGQCVSIDNLCDAIPHCMDESDEKACYTVQYGGSPVISSVPYPAVISFNGIRKFTTTQMDANDSCPDSHYRCPGQFNDCLPIYTRCNELYDCIEQQDEEGCEERTCPGLLTCRFSHICVHSEHVCDGWPHCPMYDDELWCNVECPEHCFCHAYSFLCLQPFNAKLFPQIRYLDASGSAMTLSDVSNRFFLIYLVLARCCLTALTETKMLNLRFLDLSWNELHYVNMTYFLGLKNLQSLSLSHNPISILCAADLSSNFQRPTLISIDLSLTELTELDSKVLAIFPCLKKINLTFTSVEAISPNGFQSIQHLAELYMDGSPLNTFPEDIFKDLLNLRFISAENYKLCCNRILPTEFFGSCYAPKDEISSCGDLLQSWTYRGFLWLMTCLAVSVNLFCFCARIFVKRMASSSGFTVFVTNLIMADFLMGVYMTVIGAADIRFSGKYLHYDVMWKNSLSCNVAGFLSLLSCEVSAIIICLITLDRFVVVCFPFSTLRFGKTSAAMVCLLTWLVGFFLALLPLLPVTSHWEFYSQTGICIPLPVTRQAFKGKLYSFSILIILNFVLFLIISAGQMSIYWSVENHSFKMNSTKVSRDMTLARRLITIALTDFMCWFPIGLCGILASVGIPVPVQANVALAIFILPLNSAINPFMYTLNTWIEKQRKSKESELLAWMQAQDNL